MARNKHPEETVNLILDTAFDLFMEKGYEHTSIQDLLNNLGGLSKGAIYHHFKSKEDILEAVTDRISEKTGPGRAFFGGAGSEQKPDSFVQHVPGYGG